ncbi:AGE family epimerase/isomerase [bacterium]|nr:AGE family epimerase/isomerase [bacterium]
MEAALTAQHLHRWFPACLDTVYGGFLTSLTHDFKAEGNQDKWIVIQARQTWTAATAAEFFPNDARYRKAAECGYRFLRDCLWDDRYGGFYQARTRDGRECGNSGYGDEKRAYGTAFALYGLAAYSRLTGDTEALQLAARTFQWLETYSHDPVHGGYFEHMRRDGSVFRKGDSDSNAWDAIGFGLKDQNSSIHLLEAFTELVRVWPDSLLKVRLREMLVLIRDRITTSRGHMNLYFEPDWTPVSLRDSSETVRKELLFLDHVSFGHDIETAFLLTEASEVLGCGDDAETWRKARIMTNHTLEKGFDPAAGGIYNAGYYSGDPERCAIVDSAKHWWVQAEGLHTLLLLSRRWPDDTRYLDAFQKMWSYIDRYLIDWEYGGWFSEGLDTAPGIRKARKGHHWKAAYHDGRALMACLKILNLPTGAFPETSRRAGSLMQIAFSPQIKNSPPARRPGISIPATAANETESR